MIHVNEIGRSVHPVRWMRLGRLRVSIVMLFLLATVNVAGRSMAQEENESGKQDDEAIRFFEDNVLPILENSCMECHGEDPDDLGGALSLISRATILEGGDSGPAIDIDEPNESMLLDAVNYGTYEMPPSGQLPKDQIDILTKWVEMGAPWTPETADRRVEAKHGVPTVNAESKKFWSFQTFRRPQIPDVKRKDWGENAIDRFILARLENADLQPAEQATKRSLVRRAYYDLIGLPPTAEQVQEFVNNSSPDAYSTLVDQLLESPHYGEKWGRHWLDVVRYAESNSFERDGTKPFVWRYRDYVIRSFNDDKPYDQFLVEQLAGDEIPNATAESLIATGYYRLGQWDDEPADPEQARYDDLDDILATTSQTMMGLSINCARCHDHKIDPVPSEDYYRMLAFFQNVRRYGVRSHETVLDASTRQVERDSKVEPAIEKRYQERLNQVLKRMKDIESVVKKDFEPVEHEDFQYEENRIRLIGKRVASGVITQQEFDRYKHEVNQLQNLRKNPPHLYRVLCVKERESEPEPTHVLIRGNPHAKGDVVQPGFISVLSPPEPRIQPSQGYPSSGRRLALAQWIASSEHPLTARVMVNRIWQHHFGRGIVRTSNDFGFQGDRPTHPELLDWLATEFTENGWSVKHMHRVIMNSRAYQMAFRNDEKAVSADPLNNLFWRFNMRRLTAEEVRDSILAVSGRLNTDKVYGPSVFVPLSQEVLSGQSMPGAGWGKSSDQDQRRRSVYIHIKRSLQVPLLANFDMADTDFTCPVRFNTTQPTQALGLLNSEFTNSEARKFAAVVRAEHESAADQVKEILQRVTQRDPTQREIEDGVQLMNQWQQEDQVSEDQALAYFCLVAFNLNEFIFID